jgi:uncharacterized protein
MKRYCEAFILQDLKKKMVFVGGPRQVGKTTLAKKILNHDFSSGEYFNWDYNKDRDDILHHRWGNQSELIVFDELHKYPQWKQWIKGVYDVKSDAQQYLLTGSARMDVCRRGDDSLMGRYHYWRLHPFTLDELPRDLSPTEAYERLLVLGGFPEPFLQGDKREARRWRNERFDRVIKEDVRDLEDIRNIQKLYLFVDALRERSGSLIAISNIATDLQISTNTAQAWLALIERMYIAFPVYPLTNKVPRSIQKPLKVYFYDNADIANDLAVRLENLVATTLLKRLHFIEDYYGYKCHLHYIRDKDGREVSFVTEVDGKIQDLIEVKLSDTNISKPLKYYQKKLNPVRTVQLVDQLRRSFDKDNVLVTDPIKFFVNPPWENVKKEELT